jgi:hypothetical protein
LVITTPQIEQFSFMTITFRRVDQFKSELVNWLKPTNSVVKCKVIGQFDELVNSVSQFAFPCMMILLTNLALNLKILGTLNGFATTA